MADVELLLLPEHFAHQSERVQEHVRDYALANLAPLQAENARLRAELDNKWADGMHSCHDQCQREACVLRRRAERLEEALRGATDDLRAYRHYGAAERWRYALVQEDRND